MGARPLVRPRVTGALVGAVALLGSSIVLTAACDRLHDDGGTGSGTGEIAAVSEAATATHTPPQPQPLTLAAAPVTVQGMDGFFSWALLDRSSGEIAGADNMSATSSTQSMIKIWLVSDYLRRLGDAKPAAQQLKLGSAAIRDSDDNAAERLYAAGGRERVIRRMIDICELTDTRPVVPPGRKTVWWSYTQMSPRDAVRLGECVKSGTAAGPRWTDWVLAEMTRVRGSTAPKDQQASRGGGRWGIIDGLPEEILDQGPVGIKNGWTLIGADGQWHLNCLAVTDGWVLAVMMRYHGGRGLDHGADTCASVASQLVTARPGAARKIPVPEVEG